MSETIAELRALSEEELIRKHDKHARHTQVGTEHYLQELYRRDQKRIAEEMRRLTWGITGMTFVMTLLTGLNVYLACAGGG